MNELLARILDAHGGMDRWNGSERVDAMIVSGGGLFPLKGLIQDPNPRRMSVWLHEERSSVFPYGASDQRTVFTPRRIAIEKLDGTPVAERRAPKDSFAGHQMSTPWDALHRAYFNGYALWTYLTTPFLLAMDGVHGGETESWREGSELWRVLRAYFPGSIETHSLIQDFFFGEDLMLRRHDYSVNIAGGFVAAQLTSDYVSGRRHPPANQASRLYARSRSPADPRNADGRDRHQRGDFQIIINTRREQMLPTLQPFEIERVRRFGEVRSFQVGEPLAKVGEVARGLSLIAWLKGLKLELTRIGLICCGQSYVASAEVSQGSCHFFWLAPQHK